MINIIEDLEKLTNIKSSVLNKLAICANYAIVDNMTEAVYNNETLIEYDIGIGKLYIEILDDCLHYKFIPSKILELGLINAVNEQENILEDKLSESINSHIYKTYKDML